jgi:hypothetical protein
MVVILVETHSKLVWTKVLIFAFATIAATTSIQFFILTYCINSQMAKYGYSTKANKKTKYNNKD